MPSRVRSPLAKWAFERCDGTEEGACEHLGGSVHSSICCEVRSRVVLAAEQRRAWPRTTAARRTPRGCALPGEQENERAAVSTHSVHKDTPELL